MKTILARESVSGCRMQTCGFTSRNIIKEIKALKDFAWNQRLGGLAINNFSEVYDIELCIFNPFKKITKFSDSQPLNKHGYTIAINPRILKKINEQDCYLEYPTLPLILRKEKIATQIELYFANEKMNLNREDFEGIAALNVQMCIETLQGIPFSVPSKNTECFIIKKGFEKLFKESSQCIEAYNNNLENIKTQLALLDQHSSKFLSISSPTYEYMKTIALFNDILISLRRDYLEIQCQSISQLMVGITEVSQSEVLFYHQLIKSMNLN